MKKTITFAQPITVKRDKITAKILGIALVFLMFGSMLGGLVNIANATSKASSQNPAEGSDPVISNEYLTVTIYPDGNFRGTTATGECIFYPAATSDLTIKIGSNEYSIYHWSLGNYRTKDSYINPDNDKEVITEWDLPEGIHVEQHVKLEGEHATFTVKTSNTENTDQVVSVRYLWDTQLCDNDGSPLKAEGVLYTKEACFKPVDFDHWSAYSRPEESEAELVTYGWWADTPDTLIFAHWPHAIGTTYSYDWDPNRQFYTPGYVTSPQSDSCVLIYWENINIPANGEKSITAFYGTSKRVGLTLSVFLEDYWRGGYNPKEVISVDVTVYDAYGHRIYPVSRDNTKVKIDGEEVEIEDITIEGFEPYVPFDYYHVLKVKAPSEGGDHILWVEVVTDQGAANDAVTFTVYDKKIPVLLVHTWYMNPPLPYVGASFDFDPCEEWKEMVELLSGKEVSEKKQVQVEGHSFWKLERRDEGHFDVYISNYADRQGPTKEDIRSYATNLADEIQAIKSDTGVSKVDIVAHGMGGLVARAYIESEDLASLDGHELYELSYKNDVRKLIMLGTPNHGMSPLILTLDFVPIGSELVIDFMKYIGKFGPLMMCMYKCVIPGEREECIHGCLVELEEHWKSKGNDLKEFFGELGYRSTTQMMSASPFYVSPFLSHVNEGKTGEDLRVEYSTIAGTYYDQSVRLEKPTDVLKYLWMLIHNGDGDVKSESVKLPETVRNHRHFEYLLDHKGLCMSNRAIWKVHSILVSNFDEEPIGLRYPHPTYHYYCCPVNVTITDQYGRVIDDVGTNEIPGAYVEIRLIEEMKIFQLPPDLTYTVSIAGYKDGNLTLIEVLPAATDLTLTNIFSNIPVENGTKATMKIVSNRTIRSMAIDYNGDGVVDEMKYPDLSEVVSDMWIDVLTNEETLGADQHTGVIETLADKPCNLTVYVNNTGDQVLHNVQIMTNVGVTKDIGDLSGREIKQVSLEFTPTTPGLSVLNVTVKSDEIQRSLIRTLLIEKFDFTVSMPKRTYDLGEPVPINISVTNEVPNIRFIDLKIEINITGSYHQTFEIPLLSIAPSATTNTMFTWDTTGVSSGSYTIVTSLLMANQEVTSDTEIISLGDVIPPTTLLTVGGPKYIDSTGNLYVSPTTPFTLTMEDNPGGSGVSSTSYRIYNSTYNTRWMTYSEIFYLTGFADGAYFVDYNSTDNAGNTEPTNTETVILDNSAPLLTVETPSEGAALQDGVTFQVSAWDLSSVDTVTFSVQCAQGNVISQKFESMPAMLMPNGKWELSFDTTQRPDGFYLLVANGTDVLGNTGITTVRFSIRNWACLELLPASESNKGGRTMPVKFSLRVVEAVDPAQPFVWNEELTIIIYEKGYPENILQNSTYGDTARDYRIDSEDELYITNFKTLKKRTAYVVEIYRKGMLIGTFEFSTVK